MPQTAGGALISATDGHLPPSSARTEPGAAAAADPQHPLKGVELRVGTGTGRSALQEKLAGPVVRQVF